MERRTFLYNTAITSVASTLPFNRKRPSSQNEKLKIAIIGTGLRGQGHLDLLLRRDDCEVAAICDVDQKMIDRSKEIAKKHNTSIPTIYDQGPKDYLRLLEKEDIDAVIIATPWRWHVPMAIACLKKNLYTGLEVSGAGSVDECWELVRASQASTGHLYFLENVCFRRDVMAVLNMVRKDIFGEMIHLECGYQHDLRGVKFNDGVTPYNSGAEFGDNGYSEAKWRTAHSVHRNGDLYPTHGIGPVSQYVNINRGNRITHLTSMASKSRGLHNYIVDHEKGGINHPNAKVEFALGDKITTMLKTADGETIVLHHDTNLPRPYSLAFRVQGTKGIWMRDNKSIYIEGSSPSHRWEEAQPYLDRYDHPLWKKYEDRAVGAGHGGMDFFLIHSFIEHAKAGKNPPFDAYDAATWMAITPLSEESIQKGSAAVSMPDFTEGGWMDAKITFALDDTY